MTCPRSPRDRRCVIDSRDEERVNRQRNYLTNPLPPGDRICAVCRSTARSGYELCYQCNEHREAAGNMLADVVAPIAYAVAPPCSIKDSQHGHNLIKYKWDQPSLMARANLSSLAIVYLAYHWDCFASVLGGEFTHITTVPSTRGRSGINPLEQIVTNRIPLPVICPKVNSACTADLRTFSQDRFLLPEGSINGARVLLVDDTWTTGSRVQSLAYTLKRAGAVSVAAVVIGRWVNPNYDPSKKLLERLRESELFDINRCAVADLRDRHAGKQ